LQSGRILFLCSMTQHQVKFNLMLFYFPDRRMAGNVQDMESANQGGTAEAGRSFCPC